MRDRYSEMCEIAECEHCDENGLRLNQLGVCDHIDYAAAAKRGMEMVREALRKEKK
jgi:hypothetical protein